MHRFFLRTLFAILVLAGYAPLWGFGFGNTLADQTTLRRISVVGLGEQEEAAVRSTVPVRIGDRLKQQDVDDTEETLRRLSLSRDLVRVTLRSMPTDPAATVTGLNPVEMIIDFRPPLMIDRIDIYPLVPADEERFHSALSIRAGDPYLQTAIEQAREALIAEAEAAGFPAAIVDTHSVFVNETDIAVGFIIQPADAPPLRKVRFRDVGWFLAPRLRSFFQDREEDPFGEGSPVTVERLKEVEQTTSQILHSRGYLEATTRLRETEVDEKGAEVIYGSDRGERFRITTIDVDATAIPAESYWQPAIERHDRKYITSDRLTKLEEALTRRAQERGYMAPEIDLNFGPARGRGEGSVAIEAVIDEGVPNTMGEVRIERLEPERGYGKSWYHRHIAPPVKEELIRRSVRVRGGDPLNRRVIEDAEQRLWRLGTFDEVAVDTAPTGDPEVRDVVVKVREQRTAGFGAALGWGDRTGPTLRVSFVERNVGGRADQFGLNSFISLTGDGFGGEVSYLDRHWKSGERLLGGEREPSMFYAAYYSQLGFREYTEERAGGRVRLSCLLGEPMGPWSNYWQVRGENIRYFPRRDREDYEENFDSYVAATLAYGIVFDNRIDLHTNNPKGFLFETSLESGAADGFLIKWANRAEWHRAISEHFGWQSTGQFGLMPTDATDVGLSDRFHLGGTHSLRGFDFAEVGPVDDLEEDLHIGGSTLVSLQNEIRYIYNEDLDFPVFLDVGTLDTDPLSFGDLRASAGLGVRFRLPGTEDRGYFYYAHPIASEDTDGERSFHFGLRFGL